MTFFQEYSTVTSTPGAVPVAPANFAGAAGVVGADFAWTANDAADIVLHYGLYRAAGLNAVFGSASLIATTTDIKASDLTAAASTDYTYFLIATNVYGDSLPTAGVNITTSSNSIVTPPTEAGVTTTEALSAGNICNIYASSGAKVQKANATDTSKPANCFVLAAFGSGVAATVYFAGQIITGLSGLTPGATYWLDTTGGAIVTSPPSGSGNGVQEIGVALSTTTLFFNPRTMIGL